MDRTWKDTDEININFKMPVEVMTANANVRENIGKVAIMSDLLFIAWNKRIIEEMCIEFI